jgi:hypothetical protein
VSDELCKWPNTLSRGLARKGRYERNTGEREFAIIENPADSPCRGTRTGASSRDRGQVATVIVKHCEVVLLYARGLTTGDTAAHIAQIYDAQVSKDTISRIADLLDC